MPFATLTSDGLSIAVFLVNHDWNTKFSVSYFFAGDVAAGLSGREERTPRGEALMLSVSARIWAPPVEAQALRDTFATLGKGWVGFPLYADQFLGSDYGTSGARIHDAQRLIDLTTPAIVASTAALVAGHTYAPLVVGHITELPKIEPQSGTLALCSMVLTEDSPWSFRIGVASTVAATAWPASLAPDWSRPPTETPVSGLGFDKIGQQRESTIANEERAFQWTNEAGFTLTSKAQIATLLGFFLACRGQWQAFPAPLWWTPGTPTAAAPHQTTVRFTDSTLKLDFVTGRIAGARIGFTQVPWEIVGTAGETPQQPPRVYLYQLTYDVPSPVIWRFTNCWRALTHSTLGTFNPAPMEHDSIAGGLDLANEDTTLNSFLFGATAADNPFYLFNPDHLEGRLLLHIFELTSDTLDAEAAQLVWFGSIISAPQTGRKIAAAGKWMCGLIDREFPAVRIGPQCSTCFLSKRCGHLKATFAKTGTLTASAGSVITVTCSDAAAANFYAPGKIEVGSGLSYESRRIKSSTPVAGGQQFTLEAPLRQPASGQAIVYLLTCDQTMASCQRLDPAGWRARFRGDPFIPVKNFSFPSNTSAATAKK